MAFMLTIETTNAAFGSAEDEFYGRATEVARILEWLTTRVRYGMSEDSGAVLDANGNNVGRWALTAD